MALNSTKILTFLKEFSLVDFTIDGEITLSFSQMEKACICMLISTFYSFKTIIYYEFIFSSVKLLSWHLSEVSFDAVFVIHHTATVYCLHLRVDLPSMGLGTGLLPFNRSVEPCTLLHVIQLLPRPSRRNFEKCRPFWRHHVLKCWDFRWNYLGPFLLLILTGCSWQVLFCSASLNLLSTFQAVEIQICTIFPKAWWSSSGISQIFPASVIDSLLSWPQQTIQQRNS